MVGKGTVFQVLPEAQEDAYYGEPGSTRRTSWFLFFPPLASKGTFYGKKVDWEF